MVLEVVHEPSLGLAHILCATLLAGHAVNQIGTLARDIEFGRVFTFGCCGEDFSCFVDFGAISAVVIETNVICAP